MRAVLLYADNSVVREALLFESVVVSLFVPDGFLVGWCHVSRGFLAIEWRLLGDCLSGGHDASNFLHASPILLCTSFLTIESVEQAHDHQICWRTSIQSRPSSR